MSATKHTRGPWQADEFNNVYTSYVPADFATGSKPRRALVADVRVSFRPSAESRANAKLIAAAPDLLEALRDMVSDHACLSESTIQFARAALKKAAL